MAQIQKGTTYGTTSPSNLVSATNLNDHVDDAVLLPGAVTDQTAKTVLADADTILVHSAADVALRKTTAAQMFASPRPIGSSTANSGKFTSLEATGQYKSAVTAVGALDIDCSLGNYFTKTINANSTFTFSNAPSGAYAFALEVENTSGTISWPATVKWPNDTAPTLSTGKTHLFVFVTDDSGARWRGMAQVNYTT
jgi:hypothetical protein